MACSLLKEDFNAGTNTHTQINAQSSRNCIIILPAFEIFAVTTFSTEFIFLLYSAVNLWSCSLYHGMWLHCYSNDPAVWLHRITT